MATKEMITLRVDYGENDNLDIHL